jgi:hypothetical protein
VTEDSDDQLTARFSTDTGSRPFECKAFDKRFTRMDTLARHLRVYQSATRQPEPRVAEVEIRSPEDVPELAPGTSEFVVVVCAD